MVKLLHLLSVGQWLSILSSILKLMSVGHRIVIGMQGQKLLADIIQDAHTPALQ